MAADRAKEMWSLAYELAKSGDYPNYPYIEVELRARGFKDVDEIAKNKPVRDRITKMCFEAQKRQTDA